MKRFILISIMTLMCLSCNSQPSAPTSIPNMEYGDCEDTNYIIFEMYGILDFNYEVETGIYTISYDDPDAFDYDNLAYLTNEDDWYGEFIIIYLNEADFFELFRDTKKSQEEKDNIVWREKWQIKEIRTPVPGGVNLKYQLVKNPAWV